MKLRFSRLIYSCVSILLLSACASVPEAPLRGVTSLTEQVSGAGRRFSLAYMPDAQKVSVHLVWPNDYAHSAGVPVVSSLGVELMSSGGAGGRSARQIKQDMTGLGSGASVVATPDHIYATFSASPETLDETLLIVRDVIAEPVFDDLRFQVSKEAKQKRVQAQLAKPSSKLWSAARSALLGDSTLTDYWNNTPIDEVVTALTLEDLNRWHKETFTSQDVTVTVAGNIETERAAGIIDQLLGSLPASRNEVDASLQTLNPGLTVLLHDESAPTTLVAMIGLLPASREGGEVADIVAVSALGKARDSRLWKASEDFFAETDSISASIANFSRGVRVFGINLNVANDSVAAAIQLVEDTYNDFRSGNLDDQEVLRGVVPFVNSLQKNDNNPDLLAYGLGQLLLDDLPQDMLLTVAQDSLALKATEINQRISNSYPEWGDVTKVVLSNDAGVIDADCVVVRLEEIYQCGARE